VTSVKSIGRMSFAVAALFRPLGGMRRRICLVGVCMYGVIVIVLCGHVAETCLPYLMTTHARNSTQQHFAYTSVSVTGCRNAGDWYAGIHTISRDMCKWGPRYRSATCSQSACGQLKQSEWASHPQFRRSIDTPGRR
jgi:hypothetical protein